MVSFACPRQLELVQSFTQSYCLDNGAFSAWKAGAPIVDWAPYYEWVGMNRCVPSFDWAVIPDVIDGSEADNDRLLDEWPFPRGQGVPVWHLHESFERLARLCDSWPRVGLGSSGDFATVGTRKWWDRMAAAMDHLDGRPTKFHGLRMLSPRIFTRLPLASADSTVIARNIGIDLKWKGGKAPITKESRAQVLRDRLDTFQAALTWIPENGTL